MHKIVNSTYSFIDIHFNHNIYTNVLGVCRSIMALGLLLTLILNSVDVFSPTINGRPTNTFLLENNVWIIKYNFFLLFGLNNIFYAKCLAIAILLLIVSGIYPRYTCILDWWIHYSFINFSMSIDGGDQIASNIILLMIPIYLLDGRRSHWNNLDQKAIPSLKNLFVNFIYKLIRIQVFIIYFHAAIGKFAVTEWADGTAIYYWFNNTFFKMSDFSAPILSHILTNGMVVSLITWGVILFELVLSLGLVIDKKYRKTLMYAGILFHFLIMIIIGLFGFFFAASAAIIIFLWPIDEPMIFNKLKIVRYVKEKIQAIKTSKVYA